MSHGPSSSEDNAVEGKFSCIAVSGTIDRNHTRSITGAANHHATFSVLRLTVASHFPTDATDRPGSMPSRRPPRVLCRVEVRRGARARSASSFRATRRGRRRSRRRRIRRKHCGGGGGHAAAEAAVAAAVARRAARWKLRRIGFRQRSKWRRNKFRRAFGPVLPLHRRQHVAGSSECCDARRRPALHSFHHARRSCRVQRARHKAARCSLAASAIRSALPQPCADHHSHRAQPATRCARAHSRRRSSSARSPHVPAVHFDIRPIFFGPVFGPGFGIGGRFGPFFFGCGGGFFGGGFGFGFGLGYGYGYCDPFWGCPGGFYGSYYNGGYYGNQIYNQSTDDSSVSNEFNPSRYWGPPLSAPPEETGGICSASSSDSAKWCYSSKTAPSTPSPTTGSPTTSSTT